MYIVGQLFMFNVDDINGSIDKRIIKIKNLYKKLEKRMAEN